jgi:hypothetical protein
MSTLLHEVDEGRLTAREPVGHAPALSLGAGPQPRGGTVEAREFLIVLAPLPGESVDGHGSPNAERSMTTSAVEE